MPVHSWQIVVADLLRAHDTTLICIVMVEKSSDLFRIRNAQGYLCWFLEPIVEVCKAILVGVQSDSEFLDLGSCWLFNFDDPLVSLISHNERAIWACNNVNNCVSILCIWENAHQIISGHDVITVCVDIIPAAIPIVLLILGSLIFDIGLANPTKFLITSCSHSLDQHISEDLLAVSTVLFHKFGGGLLSFFSVEAGLLREVVINLCASEDTIGSLLNQVVQLNNLLVMNLVLMNSVECVLKPEKSIVVMVESLEHSTEGLLWNGD